MKIWSSSKSVQCILMVRVKIVMPMCLGIRMLKIMHAVENSPNAVHNALETA